MILAESALGGLFLLAILVGLYFLPTIVAAIREVPSVGSIAVINAFLGWTLVGWVVALAMAVRTVPPGSASMGVPALAGATQPPHRECPNCKRPIRGDAGVCPHCSVESEPWTFHAGVWWFQGKSGEWQWLDEGTSTFRWYRDGTPSSPSAVDMTPSRAIDPAVVKPPAALQPESVVRADEIEKLAALHERGALTDEEFAAGKARLLGL